MLFTLTIFPTIDPLLHSAIAMSLSLCRKIISLPMQSKAVPFQTVVLDDPTMVHSANVSLLLGQTQLLFNLRELFNVRPIIYVHIKYKNMLLLNNA